MFHDADTRLFYLTYRLRQPRPVRGGITRIAMSCNGIAFQDIWECRKEQLDSESIERCALMKGLDGVWRWYVSYVDPETSQWRTDVVEADSPEQLDVTRRRKVFVSADLEGVEGIKDPYLIVLGRLYYMVSSIGLSPKMPAAQARAKHATGDIFNTGLTVSSTGLSVSHNGTDF
ncbi:MAG: hypothetical protein HYU66_04450, partial [Armatimonadetes bacterium]|nr:hypothetical protein [Armatimonadota bacterium]